MSLHAARAYLQEYTPHATAIGLFVAAGVAFGLIRITSASNAPPLTENWRLPPVSSAQPAPISADDVAARFWSDQPRAAKKKAETAAPAKPAGQWRFVGTIDQGSKLLAVIESDGKVRRLKDGDSLPDGAVISSVTDGQLSVTRDGSSQTIRLFVENKPK